MITLRPNMSTYSFLSQFDEKTKNFGAIQFQTMRFLRYSFTPATGGHDFTSKMQLEEKLVHQSSYPIVRKHAQRNGHFVIRTINIKFECNEIFRLRHFLEVSDRGVGMGEIGGNGGVVEMPKGLPVHWYALPIISRLQQRHFPRKDSIKPYSPLNESQAVI